MKCDPGFNSKQGARACTPAGEAVAPSNTHPGICTTRDALGSSKRFLQGMITVRHSMLPESQTSKCAAILLQRWSGRHSASQRPSHLEWMAKGERQKMGCPAPSAAKSTNVPKGSAHTAKHHQGPSQACKMMGPGLTQLHQECRVKKAAQPTRTSCSAVVHS